MTESSSKPTSLAEPGDVTVLVFKDNLSARTFHIPLQWFSRFGFMLGLLAGAAMLTSFLAIKFYRAAVKTDPTHVMDLEQELADLKLSFKSMEVKNLELKTAAQTAAVAQVAAAAATPGATAAAAVPVPTLSTPAASVAEAIPTPTVTVTVTATPAPVAAAPAAAAKLPAGPGFLFSALPAEVQPPAGESATPSVKLENLKAIWAGKTLRVKFDISYVSQDKGNQQGRIIILARGPETLLAYPDGVLNRTGAGSLIAPDQGEFFSVSHFREVKAEFGPVRSTSVIQDVEVLLIANSESNTTTNGRILFHELITPDAPPVEKPTKSPAARSKPPAPKTAPTAVPAAPATPTDSSQVITPGYDQ